MSLDRYRARVHAAVSTNQCLDYAQDVSELLELVERQQAGLQAGFEFMEAAYIKAVRGPFLGSADVQSSEQAHRISSRMWDAINDAMGRA